MIGGEMASIPDETHLRLQMEASASVSQKHDPIEADPDFLERRFVTVTG